MLELGRIDKKQTVSNEVLTESTMLVLSGVLLAVGVLFFWGFGKYERNSREKSQAELNKAMSALLKYYPNICNYVNTSLKNDNFLFKEKHKSVKVDTLINCAKVRIPILKKLLNLPMPSKKDTFDSYEETLQDWVESNFNGSRMISMPDNSGWDTNNFDTYAKCGWFDASKVLTAFKLIKECKDIEEKWIKKYTQVDGFKLSNGWTLRLGVFNCCINYDFVPWHSEHSATWKDAFDSEVNSTLKDIATYLKSYLIKEYGKDVVKNAIAKTKAKM